MGEIHDSMATYCGDYILNKIRSGDDDFKQIFSTKIIRSADWDWPRPDYVCVDEEQKCSYALEFKPPHQSKREYLTGLGQSLSYLQKHLYSGLIVPHVADDGFKIAEFIRDTLVAKEFENVAISLFSYNPADGDVSILRRITQKRNADNIKDVDLSKTETFWLWWRDCSQYELYDLLNLSFLHNEADGDIYTDLIYPEFYERLVTGKTLMWEGVPRQKTRSDKSYTSEKQNYKIPLSQLELWYNGRLTDLGIKMLEIGKKYGPSSDAFMSALGYLILVNGKHLDLIKMFEKYQAANKIPDDAKKFLLGMENYLTAEGCIGNRKPGEITTNAKATYIRDEPKLWNKLGIVEGYNKRQIFFPNEGYVFDWHKIADILISGSELLNN